MISWVAKGGGRLRSQLTKVAGHIVSVLGFATVIGTTLVGVVATKLGTTRPPDLDQQT